MGIRRETSMNHLCEVRFTSLKEPSLGLFVPSGLPGVSAVDEGVFGRKVESTVLGRAASVDCRITSGTVQGLNSDSICPETYDDVQSQVSI